MQEQKDEKLVKALQLIEFLLFFKGRYTMFVDDNISAIVGFFEGMRFGLGFSGVQFGQTRDDYIEPAVEVEKGFEYSAEGWWHQMQRKGASATEVAEMGVEIHVEVLKRRYNLDDNDISQIKHKVEAELENRKKQNQKQLN